MKIIVEWVGVHTRLPTQEGLYTVIYRMEKDGVTFEEISVARFKNYNFRVRCQHSYAGEITHWLDNLKMPS